MTAKPSRLGELLLDMRLVDEASLEQALQIQRDTGRHLPAVLAEQRVLDEERLTKAVAARLGLEAVSISSHKVHDRVLALVPYPLAKRHGLLPIAIKRTQSAEVLYLVMVDPLNTEALGEVQRATGRQVRVLMASASELDATIERHYQGLEQRLGQASGSRPPGAPVRGASEVSAPPRAAAPRRASAVARPTPSTPPPSSESSRPVVRGTPAEPARARGSRPGTGDLPRAPARAASAVGSRAPDIRPNVEGSRPGVVRGSDPGRIVPRPPPSRGSQIPVDAVRPAPSPPSRPSLRAAEPAAPSPSSLPALSQDALRPAAPPGAEPSAEISAVPKPSASPVPAPAGSGAGLPGAPITPNASVAPNNPAGPVAPSAPVGPGGRFAPLQAPPLPTGPKATGLDVPAVPKPAPFPGPGRFDVSNPATLIDTARPPEIERLSKDLSGRNDPVVPSDLDPPDAVATRIDAPPGYSLGNTTDRPAPAPAKPAMDWDLGVGEWDAGGDSAWPPDAMAEDLASTAGAPQATPHEEPVTNFDGEWSAPSALEEDGPEDIATSQLELSDVSAEDLRNTPLPKPEPAPNPRQLAATLEVPVDLDDGFNPFEEGPSQQDVPVGLERTGIFPAVDFEAEDFEPPPLADSPRAWAGTDIPDSPEAVEARFGEARQGEDDDGIEAIEEVSLEPLDEGGDTRADEPLVPGEDSDAESMPVIEPSSLVSLMDESAESEDTGADDVPVPAKPAGPQPPTRVFDESNRQVAARPATPEAEPPPAAPAAGAEPEEPTNPRFAGIDRAELDAPPTPADPAPSAATAATVEEPVPDEAQMLAAMQAEAKAKAAAAAAAPATLVAAPVASAMPEPEPEDPTPAQDGVVREEVLSALEGAFVPRAESAAKAGPGAESAGPTASAASRALVDALVAGSSLASAERAQLVLALGRLLIAKGILTADALVEELDRDGPADLQAASKPES